MKRDKEDGITNLLILDISKKVRRRNTLMGEL